MRQTFRKIIACGLLQEYKLSRNGSKPKKHRSDFDERPLVAQNWNKTTEQMMKHNFPGQNVTL